MGDSFTQLVSTPAEAHAAMKKILLLISPTSSRPFTDGWRYGRGSDLTSMNVETLSAIVEDAHGAGIKVFTHTVTSNGAKIAAGAGAPRESSEKSRPQDGGPLSILQGPVSPLEACISLNASNQGKMSHGLTILWRFSSILSEMKIETQEIRLVFFMELCNLLQSFEN